MTDGSFRPKTSNRGSPQHLGMLLFLKENTYSEEVSYSLLSHFCFGQQHSSSPGGLKVENAVRQKRPDYREGSSVWSYKTTDSEFHGIWPKLKSTPQKKPPEGSSRRECCNGMITLVLTCVFKFLWTHLWSCTAAFLSHLQFAIKIEIDHPNAKWIAR